MLVRWAVLSAVLATAAAAQTWEVAPVVSYLRLSHKPLGSANSVDDASDDDTTLQAKQPAYGARVTLNTKGYYGLELSYLQSRTGIQSAIIPTDEEDKVVQSATVTLRQIGINGICYFMPRGERWRPFVTAGFQTQYWSNPGFTDWTHGSSRNIGLNWGGGVKLQLNRHLLVRFDGRQIIAGAPYGLTYPNDENAAPRSVGTFSQLEASVGIGFTF